MPFRTLPNEIAQALDDRRKHEADIKHRIYVRPESNRGLHVVKESLGSHEYVVGGPSSTFAPGTVVPTGSNTGGMGEFILSSPPPGRKGSAGEWKTKTKDGCPLHHDDERCIGIVDAVAATNTLHAYNYTGRTRGSLIRSGVIPPILNTGDAARWGFIAVTPTLLAFTADEFDNDFSHLVYWNLQNGGFTIDSRDLEADAGGSPAMTIGPVLIGGSVFWGYVDPNDQAFIYRQAIGAADGGVLHGEITGNIPISLSFDGSVIAVDATAPPGWGFARTKTTTSDSAWYHPTALPDGFLFDLRVYGHSMGWPFGGGHIFYRRFSKLGPETVASPSAVRFAAPGAAIDVPIWPVSGSGWGEFASQGTFYASGASVHLNASGQLYLWYDPASGKLLISDTTTTPPPGSCPSPLVTVESTPQGLPTAMCIVG